MGKVPPSTPNEHALNKLSDWIDRHKSEFGYAFKAVGLAGVAIILHSIRGFSRFTAVNSIPADLIRRGVVLRGDLVSVRFARTKTKTFANNEVCPVLDVLHQPLISWPVLKRQASSCVALPIVVASIRVTDETKEDVVKYLKPPLEPVQVRFRLLKRESITLEQDGDVPEALSCIIYRPKGLFRQENVGLSLVSQGLATPTIFDQDLERNRVYKAYYQALLKAEDVATKKQVGVWQVPDKEKKGFLKRMFSSLWRKLRGT